MYQSYFGFKEKPFSLLPDPRFLYLGEEHSKALAMLQYGVESLAGFVVITGEIGSGKTTLVRKLLDDMDDDGVVGLITNTHHSFGDLLQWILSALSIDYKHEQEVENYQVLTEFLLTQNSQGKTTIVIVDEAQNLSVAKLEELRVISNLNVDRDQIIQIILVGQPELRSNLKEPQLAQFAQRISFDYHLKALGLKETRHYIHHRLSVAGGRLSTFAEEAIEVIHENSGGVPRLINILCDTGLVYAFAAVSCQVSVDIIREVIRDKSATGLLPLKQETIQQADDRHRLVRFPESRIRKVRNASFIDDLDSSIRKLEEQIHQLKRKIESR